MNNFEVQYTIRLYNPSLIAELAAQYEKEATSYKNKNEFMTDVIALGLKAKQKTKQKEKEKAPQDEKDDLYALLLKVFDYLSSQFKALHVKESALERLLCVVYNIAIALNNGETLFSEKIEKGFYDDLPARFEKIIASLMKEIGLSNNE